MSVRLRFSLLLASACAFSHVQRLHAQTVQLPTYHYFTSSGSVLVPDRGNTVLGGVGRARSGRTEARGLLPSQAAGGAERQVAGVAVGAQIHDLRAMDESLLGRAAARSDVPTAVSMPTAARDGRLPSVAEIRRQQSAQREESNSEAQELYRRGRAAQAAGKLKAAQIFYRMAARRASGQLAKDILATAKLQKSEAR